MVKPEGLFREVLDNLMEGVYFVDKARRITYWSKTAEKITGFRRREVVGSYCMDNILNHVDENGVSLCTDSCPATRCLDSGIASVERLYLHRKDGRRIQVSVRVAPIKDENGAIIGALETFADQTAQSAALTRVSELLEMALVDPLTRLANRRHTENTIRERLEESRRFGWNLGILFIDLDDFKKINDTSGHDAGDEALQVAARTLTSCLRPFDLVGRWGGDEFVAVLVHISRHDLSGIAERTRGLIADAMAFLFKNEARVTVSVGAVMAHHSDTVGLLLKRADELMYRSKQEGGDRVTVDNGASALEGEA